MVNQRNPIVTTYTREAIHNHANEMLRCIRSIDSRIAVLEKEFNAEIEAVTANCKYRMETLRNAKTNYEKDILSLMKKNKGILFDKTDVVNLPHGSLIHNVDDKVTIPRDALQTCKENKFTDVIKVVESLDRDVIEKWPDAKLAIIGAERKKKEEFKYSLKGER